MLAVTTNSSIYLSVYSNDTEIWNACSIPMNTWSYAYSAFNSNRSAVISSEKVTRFIC